MKVDMSFIGRRCGRLVVVGYSHTGKRSLTHWRCKCDCGKEIITGRCNLNNGNKLSCGCLNKEATAQGKNRSHGLSKTPAHQSWRSMITRCQNENAANYHLYGGRGIMVCARWLSAENFIADMGERPAGTSLDRINNDGNYEPGNCRWATAREQRNNLRCTPYIEINGRRQSISDWCREIGISRVSVYRAFKRAPADAARQINDGLRVLTELSRGK